jgi:hypothetical protein
MIMRPLTPYRFDQKRLRALKIAACGYDSFEVAHELLKCCTQRQYEEYVQDTLSRYQSMDLERVSVALDVLENSDDICPECHCPCQGREGI